MAKNKKKTKAKESPLHPKLDRSPKPGDERFYDEIPAEVVEDDDAEVSKTLDRLKK